MSLPQVTWPAESLEEAKKRREADEAFARETENANFSAWAEEVKHTLWGIWELHPEEWEAQVAEIQSQEAQDPESNPDDATFDADLLAAFDTPSADAQVDTSPKKTEQSSSIPKEWIQVASRDNPDIPLQNSLDSPTQNDEDPLPENIIPDDDPNEQNTIPQGQEDLDRSTPGGYIWEDTPQNLETPLNPSEQTIINMESTFWALNPEGKISTEQFMEKLNNSENRKQNKERAEELFFSPDKIQNQISLSCDGDIKVQKQTQKWFDENIRNPHGVLKESFERIEGNFVIPEAVGEKNIWEICQNDVTKAGFVHDALVDAILLEVQDGILAGKMNYPEEKVNTLIEEIRDIETTPLEKIQTFGEIHTLVNTADGKSGAKDKKNLEQTQANAGKQQAANLEFQQAQAQLAQATLTGNAQKIAEAQKALEEAKKSQTQKVKEWEAFGGWVLDVGTMNTAKTGTENRTA